jgi:hypothetical protein
MSVHVRYWESTTKMSITPSSAVASAVVRGFLPGWMLSTGNGLALASVAACCGVRPAWVKAGHRRGAGIRDGILHQDLPGAVHHHVELAGAEGGARLRQAGLFDQLHRQPRALGQVVQLGLERR